MIDRRARDQLADAIRALVSGRISNDEFERRCPRSSDPAVSEVFSQGAWMVYSDLREYRLRGKHRLSIRERKEVARWILFLKGERPYEWPTLTGLPGLVFFVTAVVTLGISRKLYRRQFEAAGEIEVWPFIRREHFDEALKTPVYLHAR